MIIDPGALIELYRWVLASIEPSALWLFDPWLISPILKLCLFMPWNPFLIVTQRHPLDPLPWKSPPTQAAGSPQNLPPTAARTPADGVWVWPRYFPDAQNLAWSASYPSRDGSPPGRCRSCRLPGFSPRWRCCLPWNPPLWRRPPCIDRNRIPIEIESNFHRGKVIDFTSKLHRWESISYRNCINRNRFPIERACWQWEPSISSNCMLTSITKYAFHYLTWQNVFCREYGSKVYHKISSYRSVPLPTKSTPVGKICSLLHFFVHNNPTELEPITKLPP